jgi:hypothetical protein
MTTFFMEGCVSNDEQAIKYFDAIYLPVQEVVELDNQFQEQLHGQLIAADAVKSDEDLVMEDSNYQQSISDIKQAYTTLKDYLDVELVKLKKIEIYNNESSYQKAGIVLLTTYSNIANTDFSEMVEIIAKEDIAEEDNERFNQLLKHSSEKLNLALEEFYDTALDYGDRYEIDLEFDED